MTAEFQVIDLEIPAELAGKRLDSALARLAAGAFAHSDQGLDRGRRGAGRQAALQDRATW